MSWRDAPLYVEAHDLAAWVLLRIGTPVSEGGRELARTLIRSACHLLTSVSLALTFPQSRAAHLEQADHDVVRLRVLLRVAKDVGLLSAGGLRFVCERLRVIGRMIGGWRKRVDRPRAPPSRQRAGG